MLGHSSGMTYYSQTPNLTLSAGLLPRLRRTCKPVKRLKPVQANILRHSTP